MKTTLHELQEMFHLKDCRQIKASLVNKITFVEDGIEVSGAKLEKLIEKFRSEVSLTSKEVCRQYHITPETLNYLIKVNKIPYYKLSSHKGSKLLFFKSDLEQENVMKVFLHKGINSVKFAKLMLSLFNELDGFTEREQKILTLHFLEGKSASEIAKMFNLGRSMTHYFIRQASTKLIQRIRYSLSHARKEETYQKKYEDLKTEYRYVFNELDKISPRTTIGQQQAFLNKKIIDLDFSVRCINSLKLLNIETVSDLLKFSVSDVLRIRNFGKKSFNEIIDNLKRHGLELRKD